MAVMKMVALSVASPALAVSLFPASLLISLPALCSSSALLSDSEHDEWGSVADLQGAEHVSETTLLETLRLGLGSRRGPRADSSKAAEKVIAPIFKSLPKNEKGKLGHPAVSYALHQYFMRRHGWSVHGLTKAVNVSASASQEGLVLKKDVLAFLQEQLHQLQGKQGMSLGQLAVLASTLEQLVQEEALAKLDAAYAGHALKPSDKVTVAQAVKILETRAAASILGVDLAQLDRAGIEGVRAKIWSAYPAWAELSVLINKVVTQKAAGLELLSSADVLALSEEIAEQHRNIHSNQCSLMKHRLLELGRADHQEGDRVWLEDFHRSASSTISRHFTESAEQLRSLGALDDSSSQGPRVIMPNYLGLPSNCMTVSGFYAMCCVDECSGLLSKLETAIGSPTADPGRITDVIAAINSSTVSAPRELSVVLMKRLSEIANRNAGLVPLHGHLFAQWMHRAFPHECPRSSAGVTTPSQSPFEWTTDLDSSLSDSDSSLHLLQIGFSNSRQLKASVSGAVYAVKEEEDRFLDGAASLASPLFPSEWISSGQVRPLIRAGMMVAALVSSAVGLFRVSKVALEEFKAEETPPTPREVEFTVSERYHV